MGVEPQTPPQDRPPVSPGEAARRSTSEGRGKGEGPKRPPRPRASGDLGRVKTRLMELVGMLGFMQGTAGLVDPRHAAGAQVTDKLGESLVDAWIKLAQENDTIKATLLRLTTGGAVGEAAIITAVFLYSQGQVYGLVPAGLPNPYLADIDVPVPPSEDVQDHARERGDTPWATGDTEGDGPSAVEVAEQQRQEAEQRRQDNPPGVTD